MLHSKPFKFAILAAVCLLGIGAATRSTHAQWATEWSGGSVIKLGGLPGTKVSVAASINDRGQVVGDSAGDGFDVATLWSAGSVINLGGLPGSKRVV